MTVAPAPVLPAPKPLSPPTPGERQATWATIFLFLAAFWYGVVVGVTALWNAFVG